MGGCYPPLNRAQVEVILRKLGFTQKPQKGSSHTQWEGYTKSRRRIVTVDNMGSRKETYGRSLMASMIRQSGLSKKQFYDYLIK